MNKSKFAGLAEARLKDIDAEGAPGIDETPAPAPQRETKKKAVKRPAKAASSKPRKPDAGKASKAAATRPGKPAGTVSLSINVPADKRRWWNLQAMLQETTVTDAIIEALDKRFGLPKKIKL